MNFKWDNIRWVFPVIFGGIVIFHSYGYLFPRKIRPVPKDPPAAGQPPIAFDNSVHIPDPPSAEEKKYELRNEFVAFCNSLADRAMKEKRDPPATFENAIDWSRETWKQRVSFKTMFPKLLNKIDPWQQRYVYRVDRATKSITLQSLGCNQRDDAYLGAKSDDVLYEIKYDSPKPQSSTVTR